MRSANIDAREALARISVDVMRLVDSEEEAEGMVLKAGAIRGYGGL